MDEDLHGFHGNRMGTKNGGAAEEIGDAMFEIVPRMGAFLLDKLQHDSL